MTSPINNIARSAISDKSLNVLCFLYSDWFNTELCNALPDHQFYAPINDANKPATWNFNLYKQPSNLTFIPNFQTSNVQCKVDFDIIICNDRSSQYQISKQLSDALHINIVIIEHLADLEYIDITSMIPSLKQTKHDTNVFLEDGISDKLSITGDTIRYSIPNIFQKDKEKQIFLPCQHKHLVEVLQKESNIPIKCEEYSDIEEYYKALQNSTFYFNAEAETAIIQYEVLLAMSAGCVVLTVNSPIIAKIITNMENGIIVNNTEELKQIINQLSNADIKKISLNANKTIKDKFNPNEFKTKWENTLSKTTKKVYTR